MDCDEQDEGKMLNMVAVESVSRAQRSRDDLEEFLNKGEDSTDSTMPRVMDIVRGLALALMHCHPEQCFNKPSVNTWVTYQDTYALTGVEYIDIVDKPLATTIAESADLNYETPVGWPTDEYSDVIDGTYYDHVAVDLHIRSGGLSALAIGLCSSLVSAEAYYCPYEHPDKASDQDMVLDPFTCSDGDSSSVTCDSGWTRMGTQRWFSLDRYCEEKETYHHGGEAKCNDSAGLCRWNDDQSSCGTVPAKQRPVTPPDLCAYVLTLGKSDDEPVRIPLDTKVFLNGEARKWS
ncbi:hypothetical protein HDU86_000903 [Geranomyces michiganensis]|nr:hypothetical protein HDU86_000903 [Geranomyces michiganensis]